MRVNLLFSRLLLTSLVSILPVGTIGSPSGIDETALKPARGAGFSIAEQQLIGDGQSHALYSTPQNLDKGLRCMLACHDREGGMADGWGTEES